MIDMIFKVWYGMVWLNYSMDPWNGILKNDISFSTPIHSGDPLLSVRILFDFSTGLRGFSNAIGKRTCRNIFICNFTSSNLSSEFGFLPTRTLCMAYVIGSSRVVVRPRIVIFFYSALFPCHSISMLA